MSLKAANLLKHFSGNRLKHRVLLYSWRLLLYLASNSKTIQGCQIKHEITCFFSVVKRGVYIKKVAFISQLPDMCSCDKVGDLAGSREIFKYGLNKKHMVTEKATEGHDMDIYAECVRQWKEFHFSSSPRFWDKVFSNELFKSYQVSVGTICCIFTQRKVFFFSSLPTPGTNHTFHQKRHFYIKLKLSKTKAPPTE